MNELRNNISIYPDREGSWDRVVNTREDIEVARLCGQLEAGILDICEPYNNPNTPYRNMWLISPGFSEISADRFATIKMQVRSLLDVYDFANFYFGLPFKGHSLKLVNRLPSYFRLDAMSLREPLIGVINSEADAIPVGEGEVTAMRTVYNNLFSQRSPEFLPGSMGTLIPLLKDSFGNDPIRIIVPPARLRYLGDYNYVSQVAREEGLDLFVEQTEDLKLQRGRLVGEYGRVKVIYRGFQLSHLYDEDFQGREELLKAVAREDAACYPPVTYWDEKALIGRLFDPKVRKDLIMELGESTASVFYSMFPASLNCDADADWNYFLSADARKEGYVLKPSSGREAKGLIFSKQVSNVQWEQALSQALKTSSLANYILQKDIDGLTARFKASYRDRDQGENYITTSGAWRDRLCVNIFITPQGRNGQRDFTIGDIDHTFRRRSRLIHSASDAICVPVLIN